MDIPKKIVPGVVTDRTGEVWRESARDVELVHLVLYSEPSPDVAGTSTHRTYILSSTSEGPSFFRTGSMDWISECPGDSPFEDKRFKRIA